MDASEWPLRYCVDTRGICEFCPRFEACHPLEEQRFTQADVNAWFESLPPVPEEEREYLLTIIHKSLDRVIARHGGRKSHREG